MKDTPHIKQSRFRAWLQLLRVPNLFTVPGDPLAGFLLAWDGKRELKFAAFAISASLCFYCAGLLLNDLSDLAEDRAERPQRPLPSGTIKPRSVWIACIAFVCCAMCIASLGGQRSLMTSVFLAAAIGIYNISAKKIAVLGPCLMGLCRGLSVLLGASFAGRFTPSALLAAGVIACYIAAVTNLARNETRGSDAPSWLARWLPLLAVAAGFLAFYIRLGSFVHAAYIEQGGGNGSEQFLSWAAFETRTAFFMFFFPAILVCAVTAAKLKQAEPVPPWIGLLIRALIFIQAAFCASMSPFLLGILVALGIVALWPLSHAASRRFYAS
jgi:4-hydroxybenzoate polyprenyltransferase